MKNIVCDVLHGCLHADSDSDVHFAHEETIYQAADNEMNYIHCSCNVFILKQTIIKPNIYVEYANTQYNCEQ